MRPATEKDRRRLAIPPAYTDAEVSTDPRAELIATARTPTGAVWRKYSDQYVEHQQAAKWSRVAMLQRRIPQLVQRLDADLTGPRRGLAVCLRLIALTGLRNGGEDQLGEVQAYGASSLLMAHVSVDGDTVRLRFTGKSGVEQDVVVRDGPLADYARDRHRQRASTLFDHTSADTLAYMKRVSRGDFKVHDLRTWRATIVAEQLVQGVLADAGKPATRKQFLTLRRTVATAVAATLGNTPAMALKSYIHPAVFAGLAPEGADAPRRKRRRRRVRRAA